MRAFVLTWGELSGWAAHYDPGEIGPALTEQQWAAFEATVAATVAFADAARTARAARAALAQAPPPRRGRWPRNNRWPSRR